MQNFIRTGIITALAVLFLSCGTHNIVQAPTGRFEVQPGGYNQYTPEQDIELGRQASAEVVRQMPVLPDSNPVTKYVQQLGKQLASTTQGPDQWPFTFQVVNVKEINAFALPGGPIFVNVGTIQAADDEGQLVGVIAHEMSHVILRHGTQQASKQVFAQLPLAVLGVTLGKGVGGSLAQAGAAFGLQSMFLRYSRDAEREADLLGAQIMYDAGYTPSSMVEFFSKLEKEGGQGVPQFLSDHPSPGNRVETVREATRKFPKKEYRANSAEFERTKSQVASLKPLSSEEVAKRQQQATIGDVTLQDVMPSGRSKNLDHSAFAIQYPDNWDVAGDANSAVTIAPRKGVAGDAIAYGVMINAVRPQTASATLDQSTDELVDQLVRSNPGTRVDGSVRHTDVNGTPARSVYLTGKSPVQAQKAQLAERDWLVTMQRPDNNSVLYLVFISPERDFDRLRPTFENMLRSLRLK